MSLLVNGVHGDAAARTHSIRHCKHIHTYIQYTHKHTNTQSQTEREIERKPRQLRQRGIDVHQQRTVSCLPSQSQHHLPPSLAIVSRTTTTTTHRFFHSFTSSHSIIPPAIFPRHHVSAAVHTTLYIDTLRSHRVQRAVSLDWSFQYYSIAFIQLSQESVDSSYSINSICT